MKFCVVVLSLLIFAEWIFLSRGTWIAMSHQQFFDFLQLICIVSSYHLFFSIDIILIWFKTVIDFLKLFLWLLMISLFSTDCSSVHQACCFLAANRLTFMAPFPTTKSQSTLQNKQMTETSALLVILNDDCAKIADFPIYGIHIFIIKFCKQKTESRIEVSSNA